MLMHFLLGPRVAPINKVQMKPGFVMAALIGRGPRDFRGMENAPCQFTFRPPSVFLILAIRLPLSVLSRLRTTHQRSLALP